MLNENKTDRTLDDLVNKISESAPLVPDELVDFSCEAGVSSSDQQVAENEAERSHKGPKALPKPPSKKMPRPPSHDSPSEVSAVTFREPESSESRTARAGGLSSAAGEYNFYVPEGDDIGKPRRLRNKVVNEIINTERNYVYDLVFINKVGSVLLFNVVFSPVSSNSIITMLGVSRANFGA